MLFSLLLQKIVLRGMLSFLNDAAGELLQELLRYDPKRNDERSVEGTSMPNAELDV